MSKGDMTLYFSRAGRATHRLLSLLTLTKVSPQFCSKFEVDAMDEFTSQLIRQKVGKWDSKKRKTEALLENLPSKLDENRLDEPSVKNLQFDELKLLFKNLFENEDTQAVIDLTKMCIQSRRTPPINTIINVLSTCSQNGEKDVIHQLQELCKINHPDFLKENSDFAHFVAEAVWVKGDISRSLEIFEQVYRENPYLRQRIRLMFKYLTSNSIANCSQAAQSNMISFSERILLEFRDFFPMTCVWQACFLSEWFTDQSRALELLERHSGLCMAVTNRISYVVFVSLKCHRTEAVYRLLEILLKYKMKSQYSNVLGALLDYQFRYGDWVRCSEIINWAVDNEIPLPQHYNIQLINLILNQKMNTPLVSFKKKVESKYDFKF